MKTVEEIAKIREQKRKELDLRVNTSLSTRGEAYFSLQWNRVYFFKISTNFRKL
jgi:urocanate hydratase